MIYGEEKRLQMVRSILPSSARKSARESKNYIKRAERSRARALCRKVRDDPESWNDGVDLYSYPERDINEVVFQRRASDKLAHFERWAIKITEGLGQEPDGRLAYMRGILPEGLIGWHAVQHLESYDEFETNSFNWWRIWRNEREVLSELRRRRRLRLEEEALRACVEIPDLHSELNRRMLRAHSTVRWVTGYGKERTRIEKKSYGYTLIVNLPVLTKEVGPTRPRLFRGLGDIDTFREDLQEAARRKKGIKGAWTERHVLPCHFYARSAEAAETLQTYVSETRHKHRPNPDVHTEWRHAFYHFVEAFEEHRGLHYDPRALVRAIRGPY